MYHFLLSPEYRWLSHHEIRSSAPTMMNDERVGYRSVECLGGARSSALGRGLVSFTENYVLMWDNNGHLVARLPYK